MKKLAILGLCLFAANSWADLQQGKATYEGNCVMCHGMTGKADTPAGQAMKAANIPERMKTTSDEALVNSILNGKNAMPPWKHLVDAAKAQDILNYIKSVNK